MAATRAEIGRFLIELGADVEGHQHGPLVEHLEGTERLLQSWESPEHVVLAGLCHAVYGTDGLVGPLLPLTERETLRGLIGVEAEHAVYFYASCDRLFVYPQFAKRDPIRYRDRFTEREFRPTTSELATFMELTWANALEIAHEADRDPTDLGAFLRATQSFVSPAARRSAAELLGIVLEPAAGQRG